MTVVDWIVLHFSRTLCSADGPFLRDSHAYKYILSHFRRLSRLMIYFLSYLLASLFVILFLCCGFPIYLLATEGPLHG